MYGSYVCVYMCVCLCLCVFNLKSEVGLYAIESKSDKADWFYNEDWLYKSEKRVNTSNKLNKQELLG